MVNMGVPLISSDNGLRDGGMVNDPPFHSIFVFIYASLARPHRH